VLDNSIDHLSSLTQFNAITTKGPQASALRRRSKIDLASVSYAAGIRRQFSDGRHRF
jgi:hypothetical protein